MKTLILLGLLGWGGVAVTALACRNAAPWEPCNPPFRRIPVLGAAGDTLTWRVVCP